MADPIGWDAQGNEIIGWDAQGAPVTKPAQKTGLLEDVGRSFASHAKRALIATPGLAGDTINLLGGVKDKLGLPSWDMRTGKEIPAKVGTNYAGVVPTGKDVLGAASNAKLIPEQGYQAQTDVGGLAGDVGDVVGAGLAPGGLGVRTLRMLAAGLGNAGGGALGRNFAPEWETELRLGGALAGGIGAEETLVPAARSADRNLPGLKQANAAPEALGKALNNIQVDPNALGSTGGNIRVTPPPQTNTGPSVRSAVRGLDKATARRGGLLKPDGVSKFDDWYSNYEKAGVAPLVAQAYGNAGVNEAAALARKPGETGNLAQDVIKGPLNNPQEGLRGQLQARALKALDEMSGGEQALDLEVRNARDAYAGVLGPDVVTPTLRAQMETITKGISAKNLKNIEQQAADLGAAEDAIRAAKGEPPLPMTEARQYQLRKRATYAISQDLLKNSDTAPVGGAYSELFKLMQEALHDPNTGIPGYKQIDNQYEALMRKVDVDSMLRKKLNARSEGRSVGDIGMSPADQTVAREAFGEAADPFILGQRLISRDAEAYNRIAPERGSQTMTLLEKSKDTDRLLSQGLRRGWIDHALEFGDAATGRMIGAMLERGRDISGKELLSLMTPEEAAVFRQKLVEYRQNRDSADYARILTATSRPQAGSQVEQYWQSRGGPPAWYTSKER